MERPPGEEGAGSAPEEQPPATDPTGGPGSGVPPAGPGAASEALAVLTSFGRRLLVLVPVYLAGAAGLSVGFVLFGLALYLGWRRVRDGKERSLRAARQLLDDEERITARTLYMSHRELPAWILAQVWPFLGQYMEKLLAETVAPAVRGANPHLQTFTFTRVELGEKPARIIGVKVHPSQRKDQILLDLNVSYVGDVQIDVEVKKYFCKAGVKGMQLHGVLRVILEPLMGDLPIVGAVSMFFIKRPTLDINWTGMTNLLDIPGLSSLSDTMIMDSIAAFLVLPNRLLVPLVPDLQDVAQLRSPLPRGIIRIHLLAARGLSSKDKYVKGLIEGKSDPYALVRVGTQTFCSRVIDEELNPHWGETYEVKDDSRALTLGALTLPLARLLTASELTLDQWFQLSSSGPNSRLYMKLVMRILYLDSSEICFPTVPGAQDLDGDGPQTGSSVDAPPRPCHTTPNNHFGTESVLRIHVLEAQDLIAKDRFLGGLVKGKSDPYVKLKVAGRSFRSHVVREDLNPRWNEVFEVIVTSIPGQELEIEVFDKDLDKDDFLGRYKVSLTTVLNSGFLDEWLTLEDVPSGRLHLRLERLTPRPTAAELEEVLQVNSLIQTQKSSELAAALLSVYLERAEDLPLRKGTKPPSPYATLSVGETSHKTKTVSQTSAPIWEESASFLIRKPHAESLELQILVSQHSGVEAHSHSYSHSSSSLNEEPEASGIPSHATSPVLEVRHRLPHGDSPSEAPVGPLGQVKLTVWYHSDEQKLVSIIHSCRALRQNGRDLPDPYVSLLLLPDKNRGTKRKTSQKKRTLNPEFNERFEWELPLDGSLRRKLDVSVKSNSSFMSRERELLGKVQLDLAEIDLSQGAAQWYDLMDDKDKGSS
ncbi:extended synaptotagmin-1-like protein [Cricetulus griseus]|nr:extended synaptotagmin-1-like protein [Cricetulus griseus]